MRSVYAIALALAGIGCSAPESPPVASASNGEEAPPASPPADDIQSRGTQAGLSPAQSAQIAGYEFGAVVPTLAPGWRLAAYRDETYADDVTYPAYFLQYVHDDGRCFELMAASEGLGDVFVIPPPTLEDGDVPGIALFGPVPLGWSGPDATGDWGPNRLSTEWFGVDGLSLKLASVSEDGCDVISVASARDILASLRYLDPEDDGAPAGHWAFVESYTPGGPTDNPEAHALETFAAETGEGTVTSTSTVRDGPHLQVILVTSERVADDSVRDQRTRVVYLRSMEGGWMPQTAGRQQRCQVGRGHQEWSPEACV